MARIKRAVNAVKKRRKIFKLSKAIADALQGPVTQDVPASALQLHPSVTVVLDEEAASLLK